MSRLYYTNSKQRNFDFIIQLDNINEGFDIISALLSEGDMSHCLIV